MTDDEKAKRAEALRKAQKARRLAIEQYNAELAQLAQYLKARDAMRSAVNREFLSYYPDETE